MLFVVNIHIIYYYVSIREESTGSIHKKIKFIRSSYEELLDAVEED